MNYEIRIMETWNLKKHECKIFQSVLVEVEGNVLDHIYPKQ
jgi:hypothetical protein